VLAELSNPAGPATMRQSLDRGSDGPGRAWTRLVFAACVEWPGTGAERVWRPGAGILGLEMLELRSALAERQRAGLREVALWDVPAFGNVT
jgi:hypothetical protein